MEAQKPNAKPAAKPASNKTNVPGIKNAFWVIVVCAIICVLLFIFWFGNDMHFDEDGHPQNLWGTVYKGGFIVPILQTLFLTVSLSPSNAGSPSLPPKVKAPSTNSLPT